MSPPLFLRVVRPEAKKKYKADIKGVFGSYAKVQARQESDVDVLVQFDETADLFDFVGLSSFLEERLNKRVDIVPQDDIRHELKDAILRETQYL